MGLYSDSDSAAKTSNNKQQQQQQQVNRLQKQFYIYKRNKQINLKLCFSSFCFLVTLPVTALRLDLFQFQE